MTNLRRYIIRIKTIEIVKHFTLFRKDHSRANADHKQTILLRHRFPASSMVNNSLDCREPFFRADSLDEHIPEVCVCRNLIAYEDYFCGTKINRITHHRQDQHLKMVAIHITASGVLFEQNTAHGIQILLRGFSHECKDRLHQSPYK